MAMERSDGPNEVARNSIWREHVRKEDSLYRAPAPFRVDPKKIRACAAGRARGKLG